MILTSSTRLIHTFQTDSNMKRLHLSYWLCDTQHFLLLSLLLNTILHLNSSISSEAIFLNTFLRKTNWLVLSLFYKAQFYTMQIIISVGDGDILIVTSSHSSSSFLVTTTCSHQSCLPTLIQTTQSHCGDTSLCGIATYPTEKSGT